MNLVIDIGNTRVKGALFSDESLIREILAEPADPDRLDISDQEKKQIRNCIIASVRDIPDAVSNLIDNIGCKSLILNEKTQLPFLNTYRSKTTLGHDRIAAVAGACILYPGKDVMVIDAGTALTIDFKTREEEYSGGNISPGLTMRFKALHDYTSRLPLLSQSDTTSLFGEDTGSAIINGVQNGLIFEVNTYIETMRNKYPGLIVLLTGGDCHFFDNKLKKPIFVVSKLTLLGLNFILRYNA